MRLSLRESVSVSRKDLDGMTLVIEGHPSDIKHTRLGKAHEGKISFGHY